MAQMDPRMAQAGQRGRGGQSPAPSPQRGGQGGMPPAESGMMDAGAGQPPQQDDAAMMEAIQMEISQMPRPELEELALGMVLELQQTSTPPPEGGTPPPQGGM